MPAKTDAPQRAAQAPATIKDVAKRAGVSVATVSRVVSNQTYVRDAVRGRVPVFCGLRRPVRARSGL